MSKVYDRCPQEVHDRVRRLVELHHSELLTHGVTFDLMFVGRDAEDEGITPVLSCRGVAALAVASIVSAKQRAKGCADVEILIDRDRFNDCTDDQKNALLDHEINHFELVRDKQGAVKYDAELRPNVKIRPHDYDFGWFEVVARRWGRASFEVQQAKVMWDESNQSLFPFVTDATVQPVALPIPTNAQPIPQPASAPETPADAGAPATQQNESPSPSSETTSQPSEASEAGAAPAAPDTPTPEPEPPQLRQQRWSFFFGRATARKLAPDAVRKKSENSAGESETIETEGQTEEAGAHE
jgi:hypothetical protein